MTSRFGCQILSRKQKDSHLRKSCTKLKPGNILRSNPQMNGRNNLQDTFGCKSSLSLSDREMRLFMSSISGTRKWKEMKIEEAIVYVLASSGYGMKAEQIAREINDRGLFTRWDKKPVDGKMVYAVVMSHPDTFVYVK